MAGETTTREATVTANIAAIIAKYGPDALDKINNQCLQDISLSLAMLVDNGTSSASAES